MPQLPAPPAQLPLRLHSFYHATLDPKVVLSLCFGYVAIVKVWDRVNISKKAAKKTDSWGLFEWSVLAHNILLAVFSLGMFAFQVRLLRANLTRESSLFNAVISQRQEWLDQGLHLSGWLFYLSKYYEMLDTFILLAKGKPSSFLQTFHHFGAIVTCWSLTASTAPIQWIFVFENSFIHSLMYTYYALTALGYRPSWKRHLTNLQIGQFIVGNSLALANIFFAKHSDKSLKTIVDVYGWFALSLATFRIASSLVTLAFVFALIALFLNFSRRTYGAKAA